MKLFTTFCLATLAFTISLHAQVAPGAIKLGKVLVSAPNTPEFQLAGGVIKRFTIGKWLEVEVPFDTAPEIIDQLTFNYTVAMNGKLLDGSVTHVDISKGREHYSVMYLSPHAIQRVSGGKPLSAADVQNIWVQVTYQGQVLDQTSMRPGPMPNVPHLTGQLVNKNQTPFAPLYWDRYEAIKSTATP